MRLVDAEMVEQALALFGVVRPGDGLDVPAGVAAFAPIEHDAAVVLGQVIEELDLLVDAVGRPLLDRRVEAARRIHQQRRTRPTTS